MYDYEYKYLIRHRFFLNNSVFLESAKSITMQGC